jgi:hypothetical protein
MFNGGYEERTSNEDFRAGIWTKWLLERVVLQADSPMRQGIVKKVTN